MSDVTLMLMSVVSPGSSRIGLSPVWDVVTIEGKMVYCICPLTMVSHEFCARLEHFILSLRDCSRDYCDTSGCFTALRCVIQGGSVLVRSQVPDVPSL